MPVSTEVAEPVLERPSSGDPDENTSQFAPTPARSESPAEESAPASALEPPRLSPVVEVSSQSNLLQPKESKSAQAAKVDAKADAAEPGPSAPPIPVSRPRSRNAQVSLPVGSPPSRGSRRFTTSTFGRPASVASNASSLPLSAPFAATATGKSAAATAVVTSTSTEVSAVPSTDDFSELNPFTMRGRRESTGTNLVREDSDGASASAGGSGFQSLGLGSPGGRSPEVDKDGQGSLGSSPVGQASRLIRGLSLRRRSGLSEGPAATPSTVAAKPSAVDLLRRFEGGT